MTLLWYSITFLLHSLKNYDFILINVSQSHFSMWPLNSVAVNSYMWWSLVEVDMCVCVELSWTKWSWHNKHTHTHRKPFSNVSSVNPALCVDSLGGLRWVLQIALEHVGTLHTHLKTNKIHSYELHFICVYMKMNNKKNIVFVFHLSLSVYGQIVHLRDVHQFDWVTGQRSSHVTWRHEVKFSPRSADSSVKSSPRQGYTSRGLRRKEQTTNLPALQSPGRFIVQPAVHSVCP